MTAPERGTATPAPELARRVGHAGARSPAAAGRSIRPNILPCARPSFDSSATLSRKRAADYAIDPLDFLPA